MLQMRLHKHVGAIILSSISGNYKSAPSPHIGKLFRFVNKRTNEFRPLTTICAYFKYCRGTVIVLGKISADTFAQFNYYRITAEVIHTFLFSLCHSAPFSIGESDLFAGYPLSFESPAFHP